MTTKSQPGEARALLTEFADTARRRQIVAFAISDCEDPAMFIDLPLGEPGAVYGSIGYWSPADAPENGANPHTVLAAAPSTQVASTADRLRRRFAIVDRRDVDGTWAIIATNSAENAAAPIERVEDPEPYLRRWLEAAVQT